MQEVCLLLGGNQGDPVQAFHHALSLIKEKAGDVLRISSVYSSPAWGFEGAPFMNCAVLVRTNLEPIEFLNGILSIEKSLGRERNGQAGYASRPIDIDILLWGKQELNLADLTVPHPRMHLRRFALVPLLEIMPDAEMPDGKAIRELLSGCSDMSEVSLMGPINHVIL